MKNYELDQKIQGKNAMQYMADLIEQNEKQTIEIERGKLSVSVLKQMNNRSKLLLDAHKFELESQKTANSNQLDKIMAEIEEMRKKPVDLSKK